MKIISHLKRIWNGTCTKREMMIYIGLLLAIYVLGIVVGASVYPDGFNMLEVYVSYLGGYPNNPDGYIFYNTCVFIVGILLIPEFVYIYRQLKPSIKWLNFIASIFGIFGCISFASLGIFYQGFDAKAHQWSTILTFGGFGVNMGLFLPVLIRRSALKLEWPRWWHIVLCYGIPLGILTCTIIADEFPEWFTSWNLDPRVFKDRFLEWFYVFSVIAWIIIIAAITPRNKNSRNNEMES